MHEFRTSTALRQLTDLDDIPDPPIWSWAIVRTEPSGRVRLPELACTVLGARPGCSAEVSGLCNRDALVVRATGVGRRLTVDRRGRLYVPAWLRRGLDSSLIVGRHDASRTVVLITPIVLDGVGDALIATRR